MTRLLAAPRDAAWSATVGRGGKFHAVVRCGDDGYQPLCGREMVVDDLRLEPAHGLMESEKCGAPGCRAAFERDAKQGDAA